MDEAARRRRRAEEEPGSAYHARRQHLLASAAEVFRNKGYQGVRMDDIAVQSGADRATLYYYFRNKQDIFRAVIIDTVEQNVALAREIAAHKSRPCDKLRSLIVALLDSYDRHYPYLFVYLQEDMKQVLPEDSPLAAPPDGARLRV